MKTEFLTKAGKDMMGFCLLATGALCVGLLVNQLRDQPLSLVYASKKERIENEVAHVAGTASPSPSLPSISTIETSKHPQVIGLREFKEIVKEKKGVVLDARPEIYHRLGHVPRAISFPREDFEEAYSKHKSLLESNKEQTIAVYCSDASCKDSEMVADALVKLAYHHVLVFKDGWDEWRSQKLPQEGQ